MPNDQIPIFIISFNRLEVLKAAISSFKKLSPEPAIIIHDASSTYKPLLDYLDELESLGTTIFRNQPSINSASGLNKLSYTIELYFSNHRPTYYVVTDPDIAFDVEVPPDCLDIYRHLLELHPDIEVAGPMLRIDDLPDHYPLKDVVIHRHGQKFHNQKHYKTRYRDKEISFIFAPIDTTFGMYRPGFKFRRLCSGVRVSEPYWARHLDWYINPNDLMPDQAEYLRTASKVSHWGGKWLNEVINSKKNSNKYYGLRKQTFRERLKAILNR